MEGIKLEFRSINEIEVTLALILSWQTLSREGPFTLTMVSHFNLTDTRLSCIMETVEVVVFCKSHAPQYRWIENCSANSSMLGLNIKSSPLQV